MEKTLKEKTRCKKILIVNDEPIVLKMIDEILIRHYDTNVETKNTSNAEEALEIVESFEPEVAMINVGLSGMNGIELGKILLEKYPNIKIIFDSGDPDNRTKILPGTFFLELPFANNKLVITLIDEDLMVPVNQLINSLIKRTELESSDLLVRNTILKQEIEKLKQLQEKNNRKLTTVSETKDHLFLLQKK